MSDWICSICLCNNKENTVKLEGCNHEFHSECIITCLRINGPKCPNCRGLDSRCQYTEPTFDFVSNDEVEPIFQDDEIETIYPPDHDISNDENIFDVTSDFDMEIQEMLINMVDTTNTINPSEITVNE